MEKRYTVFTYNNTTIDLVYDDNNENTLQIQIKHHDELVNIIKYNPSSYKTISYLYTIATLEGDNDIADSLEEFMTKWNGTDWEDYDAFEYDIHPLYINLDFNTLIPTISYDAQFDVEIKSIKFDSFDDFVLFKHKFAKGIREVMNFKPVLKFNNNDDACNYWRNICEY